MSHCMILEESTTSKFMPNPNFLIQYFTNRYIWHNRSGFISNPLCLINTQNQIPLGHEYSCV